LIGFSGQLAPQTDLPCQARITILSSSSGNGCYNAFASSHGARIQTSRSSLVAKITGIALSSRSQHCLGVDRLSPRHWVMSRQHARLDELHSRIGCQPIFDALFPRSPGRHHAANLPACALSSYNLRNPGTIIGHWAFD
jgi:hypothetical protein